MKKLILLFVIQAITNLSVFSQTISRPPIFNEGISVQFLGSGDQIYFIYQNPQYPPQVLIDLIDFVLPDIDEAIVLTDKILFILEMEKTEKDINISDTFYELQITRFGTYQKDVIVGPQGGAIGWRFRKADTIRLKAALLDAKSRIN